MKKLMVLKTVLIMLALMLTSCDDNYETTPVAVTDVNGNYKAKQIVSQGNTGTEKINEFTAKDSVITFKDFPVKEIVQAVVKNPVKVETALAEMGKIEYKLNYTSKLNLNNNTVELTFSPKILNLEIPVDGTIKNTVITLAGKQKGYFVGQDWSLRFGIVAEKITVDGAAISPFEIIKYDFPYCLKN